MSLKTLDFLLEFREKQSVFPGALRTVRRCSEVFLVLSSEKSRRICFSGEKTAHSVCFRDVTPARVSPALS